MCNDCSYYNKQRTLTSQKLYWHNVWSNVRFYHQFQSKHFIDQIRM